MLAPDNTELHLNIFYLDHDPRAAAQAHCDKHVVKMVLETAQILSTAWHVLDGALLDTDLASTDPMFPMIDVAKQKDAGLQFGVTYYIGNQRVYAPTHEHHPCSEWAREATGNYEWLWQLGQHLCDEHRHRYGRDHLSRHVLRSLEFPPPHLAEGPQTEPPPAMTEEYVVEVDGYVDAVASYRNYYRVGKLHLLTYRKRAPPVWVADLLPAPA